MSRLLLGICSIVLTQSPPEVYASSSNDTSPPGCGNGRIDMVTKRVCPPCIPGRRCPCSDVRRTSEECDGDDLGGKTCTDLGHLDGALTCNPSCGYEHSACRDADPQWLLRRAQVTQGRPLDAILHGDALVVLVDARNAVELRHYPPGNDTPERVARRHLSVGRDGRGGIQGGQVVRTTAGFLVVTSHFSTPTVVYLVDEEYRFAGRPAFSTGRGANGYLETLAAPEDRQMATMITRNYTGSTAIPRNEWTHQAWVQVLMPNGVPVGARHLLGEVPRYPHREVISRAVGLKGAVAVAAARGLKDAQKMITARVTPDGNMVEEAVPFLAAPPPLTGGQREVRLGDRVVVRPPDYEVTSIESWGTVGVVTSAARRHHSNKGSGNVWVLRLPDR